jgi:uncharacterized protein YndB with AHSA1/START domain
MVVPATDYIARQALLRVPRNRTYEALTTPKEFGSWFGVVLDGGFSPGARIQGRVTNEGYQHLTWEITVVDMVPDRLFSWTWHPYAIREDRDYRSETPTLVTFLLQDAPEGTLLTVVESGFDQLPEDRREEAYKMNEQGWIWEMKAVTDHLAMVPVQA